MGRRKKWKVDLLSGQAAARLLLGGLFLAGSVFGCVAAGLIDDANGALFESMNSYMSLLARHEVSAQFWRVLWETAQVPVLTLLLGFTALGVLGIPVLFAVRGFLLCYAISAFYRMLGLSGLLPAFCLFGVSALVWLPVVFQLGVQGLLGSYGMLRRVMGDGRYPLRYDGAYLLRCGLCAAGICLCAGVECLVVPALLQRIVGLFSAG